MYQSPAAGLPLTAAQAGMWLAQGFAEDRADYTLAQYVEIDGPVDLAALTEAIRRAVDDSDTGRGRILRTRSGPVQHLDPEPMGAPAMIDLSDRPDAAAAADTWIDDCLRRHSDLALGPVSEIMILRLAPRLHRIFIRCHHAFVDGFSAALWARRVAAEYRHLTVPGAPAATPFGRLTALLDADRAYRDSGALARDREYWADQLAGAPAPVSFGRARPGPRASARADCRLRTGADLSEALVGGLAGLASAAGVTLPAVFVAAAALHVARLTGDHDLVLGLPVTARLGTGVRNVPGMLSNVVPLRIRLAPDASVGEVLTVVAGQLQGALRRQRYRIEDLRRDVRGDDQERPLTGPHVNLMLFDEDLIFGEATAVQRNVTNGPVDDLAFAVSGGTGHRGWRLDVDADDSRYDHEDVGVHRQVMLRVLDGLAAGGPATPMRRLDILGRVQRAALDRHHDTAVPRPSATLTDLVHEAATGNEDAPVVAAAGGATISHAELARRGNRLARHLAAQGIGPEDVVAVSVPRGLDLMVALVGVVTAGAAYLPIDPDLPPSGVRRLLGDARPKLVITGGGSPPGGPAPVLDLGDPRVAALLRKLPEQPLSDADRTAPLRPHHPLSVVYTSGSTGMPKGVINTHEGIVNRLLWMQEAYRLGAHDRVLQKTSCGFDVAGWEFFWPLISGAGLVLAAPGAHKDPQRLIATIREHRITTVHFVPTMLTAFLAAPGASGCDSLRRVVASGEALTADQRVRLHTTLPGCDLHNLFGPTEAAIDVTAWTSDPDGDPARTPPIGAPISNVRVHVLNRALQPVPTGVAGELYLAGTGLARGYLRRPDLTAVRFVACPYGPPGTRMYRTGDLGRRRSDGELEYLGRDDEQVKVNGVRVEPAEIVATLRSHPAVAQAEVVPHADGPGPRRLVGYLVPDREALNARSAVNPQIHTEQWQELYEDLYTGTADRPFGDDFSGWSSSYDGEPLPHDEMEQWRSATVDRIRALRPRRVLEIGAGTGLILARLAPESETYWATDISAAAVEALRLHAADAGLADRVHVRQQAADDVSGLPEAFFDVIVINSVVQYFPDADYLAAVLRGAAELLAPGGAVFLGDVRNLRIQEILDAGAHGRRTGVTPENVRRLVELSASQQNELLLDPLWFDDFAAAEPSFVGADIRIRTARYDNELSRYRYDVVLHAAGGPPIRLVAELPAMSWADAGGMDGVAALLTKPGTELRVTGIPHARLLTDVALAEAAGLRTPRSATAAADPTDLAEHGAVVTWSGGDRGEIDALFLAPGDERLTGVLRHPGEQPRPGRTASDPLLTARSGELIREVRSYLRERLPEYLVPTAFVVIGELPVTANGKLDRAALPAPVRGPLSHGRAPASKREELLCALFIEVLGVPAAGPDDSFLDLGGDSITAIQLAGRARATGLVFTPREVFDRRTPAQLALVAGAAATAPGRDPDAGIGEVPPTPIVHHFAGPAGPPAGHAQSLVLDTPADLDGDLLTAAVQAVVDHHDALRLRVRRDRAGWSLHVAPRGAVQAEVRRIEAPTDLGRVTGEAASELDPSGGVLRVLHVDAGPGRNGRLVLIVHHLAVDGVSWRILAEDLPRAYAALAAGSEHRLGSVGDSYRTWAEAVTGQAAVDLRRAEAPAWQSLIGGPDSRTGRYQLDPALDVHATRAELRTGLPPETTAALVEQAAAAFHTGPEVLLLTAVALALPPGEALIDVERHGRDTGEDLDLSRTVGWFTSLFPVRLDPTPIPRHRLHDEVATAVKQVKERLAAIPGNGAGYGVLRQLAPDVLGPVAAPSILVNYLGRFAAAEVEGWRLSPGALTDHAGPGQPLTHALQIDAAVEPGDGGPRLVMRWSWAGRLLSAEEVRTVADAVGDVLSAIAAVGRDPIAGGHTPSDFPLVEIAQVEIDEFERDRPAIDALLPVTPLQGGLLFHASYDGTASDVYTVQIQVDLEGHLDGTRLRSAARALLDRHPSLRTEFPARSSGAPVQVVRRSAEAAWQEIDLRGLAGSEQNDRAGALATDDRWRRFSLGDAPLLRMTLLRLGGDRYRLLVTHHHLVLDGWSAPLLLNDLFDLYRHGAAAASPAPVTGPVDYAAWLARQDRAAARQAWGDALAGLPGPSRITAADVDLHRSVRPEHERAELPFEALRALRAQARRAGVTLNTIVQAAWGIVLSRFTGHHDVVFGTTVSGRPADLPEADRMLGMFVNTVPVRVTVDDRLVLADLLRGLQAAQTSLTGHHHLCMAAVQEAAGFETDLFDTLLVFENYPLGERSAGDGLRVSGYRALNDVHYPLALIVVPGDTLAVELGYRPDALRAATVRAAGQAFLHVLRAMAADAALKSRVGDIELLSAAQREEAVRRGRGGGRGATAGDLLSAFQSQVWRTPDAIAVSAGDQRLTYRELELRSARLAARLARHGAGPERIVGVAVPRSTELLVTLLAVLRTGAAYLPLDPAHPADRIAYTIADARPVVVVAGETSALGPLPGTTVLTCVDDPAGDAEPDVVPVATETAAYVIYTSGSTGRPKGVVVSRGNLATFVCWAVRTFGADGLAHVLASTSLSFDVSVVELFPALVTGGHVELVPNLLDLLDRPFAGTLVSGVPSVLSALVTAPGLRLDTRWVLSAGEALPRHLAERLRAALPAARLANLYGPTEATVYATGWYDDGAPLPAVPPIGRPLEHTDVYVLDHRLRPVPPGSAGELYLSGDGLTRGYLNQPGLSAARFVADPFAPPGARMYRTGDVVREDVGGVVYLGRGDDQIKIRGLRIEPGEIACVLTEHPLVDEAVVVDAAGPAGTRRLVGYVVPAGPDARPDIDELRAHLGGRLPEHMVPAVLVLLDRLPVTANGKLDRAALPPPPQAAPPGHRPAADSIEHTLAELFATIVGLPEPAGADDDFFQLGGDSISSMQLAALVRAHGWELSPRDVFQHRTPARLAMVARAARETAAEPDGAGVGEIVPTPVMHRLRELGGPVRRFHQSILVRVPASLTLDALVHGVQAVIDHHDVLRLQLDGSGNPYTRAVGSVRAADLVRRVPLGDDASVAEHTGAARDRLDPVSGEVVQAVWFEASPPGQGLLSLVVHHLAVDGVSWRILVPDLAIACAAALRGTNAPLAPVRTSFRTWSARLAATATAHAGETAHWSAVDATAGLPVGSRPLDPERDRVESRRTVTTRLEPERAEPLLSAITRGLRAPVEDVLLTALALAVQDRHRDRHGVVAPVAIDVESQGRDAVDDLDTSRTVGWFTSIHPVLLDPAVADWADLWEGGPAAGTALDRIRDQLAAVPGDGSGHGVLHFLDPGRPLPAPAHRPAVGLNYLGRFAADGTGDWTLTGGIDGGADPELPLIHALELDVYVSDGTDGPSLVARWSWAAGVLGEHEVRDLAGRWTAALEALGQHGSGPSAAQARLSDLSIAGLFQEDLDLLQDELAMEWEA
ncbi:hypothetical protein GCM10011608_35100 [Micromonospora sonchi]|uniref:Carrier domain-containing protein n=1 Tax=Micromonospora sonchi TaxID=1763543 RepID=A0A917TZW3_9ACTN|nr:non-ribosomal peptide synthetase [Micromonospora sonchi]GGM47323.1 hypothetical protein GCM10011608_35100 [Micromonospora sonchi]